MFMFRNAASLEDTRDAQLENDRLRQERQVVDALLRAQMGKFGGVDQMVSKYFRDQPSMREKLRAVLRAMEGENEGLSAGLSAGAECHCGCRCGRGCGCGCGCGCGRGLGWGSIL